MNIKGDNISVKWLAAFALLSLLLCSCDQIRKPVSEPFIGVSPPPAKQEFRWNNGRMPKSVDPARAAAPPETDVVRALFEGLTQVDPETSEAIPALAEKWTSSEDHKTWTFNIRKDARWSNGKRVIADDVVSSWERLAKLGDKAAHRELFRNIVGMNEPRSPAPDGQPAVPHSSLSDDVRGSLPFKLQVPAPSPSPAKQTPGEQPKTGGEPAKPVGLEAIGERTLKVSLILPDTDFPKLVADPVFHPIYGDGVEFEKGPLDPDIVTSGPFKIAAVAADGITLDRSDTYWNKESVGLEHVRLVAKDTAESALDAYKKGELDAVTNADFEPLALKLLTPYKDFRQSTHGALNFYEVNSTIFPFNDRRIREALAVSIDRERLVETELEGAAEPATRLLPARTVASGLAYDAEHGRELLEKSGFPSGEGFPKIRLVIARNDVQQRVARAVARMWKQNLSVDTQIIIKEPGEMEAARTSGAFDVIRRSTVLPTDDVLIDLGLILGSDTRPVAALPEFNPPAVENKNGPSSADGAQPPAAKTLVPWTQADALYELNVIPLYFPVSYSLVKPYVEGFELDGNGSPDLKGITIDSGWTPKPAQPAS